MKGKAHVDKEGWIHCPICGSKTRTRIRAETVLKIFPLYCPKCRNESLIEVETMNVKVLIEPDAKTQSQ